MPKLSAFEASQRRPGDKRSSTMTEPRQMQKVSLREPLFGCFPSPALSFFGSPAAAKASSLAPPRNPFQREGLQLYSSGRERRRIFGCFFLSPRMAKEVGSFPLCIVTQLARLRRLRRRRRFHDDPRGAPPFSSPFLWGGGGGRKSILASAAPEEERKKCYHYRTDL